MDIVTLALAKNYADSIGSGITSIKTENNKLIFILQNGNIIEVPLTDLVDNVVTEEELLNKLKNYIKNTDFASAENAGIIKVDATSYATELDNGKLKASTKTYENYKDMNNKGFIGKGTLENVLIGKKLETTNNKVTFVDEDSTDIEYPSAKAMYKVSNKLDTLKNDVLETGTDTDIFVHLEDSAMAEFQELEVDGVCEQETTTGNQLLDFSKATGLSAGLEHSFKDDILTLTGDGSSAYMNYSKICTDIIINNPGKVLYFDYDSIETLNPMDGAMVQLNIKYNDGTSSLFYSMVTKELDKRSYKIQTDTSNINYAALAIYTTNAKTASANTITITKPMLHFGTDKLEYEPYTGGQPSPNPDYPQEIKTITDSLSVTSCNKNLFDKNTITENQRLDQNGNKNFDENCDLSDYIKIQPNTTYTRNITASIYECIAFYTSEKVFISRDTTHSTTTSPNNAYYVRISCYKTNLDTLQLEKGSTATSYEEHLETQITANLPEGEFIGKINDTYKDTLKVEYNEEDGQYHLVLNKMIGKVVLDGSEGWGLAERTSNNNGVFYVALSSLGINVVNRTNASSNYAKYFLGYSNKVGQFDIHYSQFRFVAPTITITKEDWKKLLASNNLEIYFIIEKPYEVDLGVVDMPLSYDEVTNIFTDSDLMPKINAKYYRNFTSTIQNIQVNNKTLKQELVDINNRLDALESEINIESYVAKIDEINGEVI